MTSTEPLTIVTATPDDFETVMAIYENTTHWLHSLGYSYWSYPIPDWLKELVKRDIGESRVFICQTATSESVGTFRLAWSDPRFWPEDGVQTIYLHGFGVRRELKGQGIGTFILEWIKEYARTQGKHCLRLDCEASNKVLCNYYEQQGFKFCGLAEVKEFNYTGARYELGLV